MTAQINCRAGCGACCIAPSITSPIPGMPLGKKAGERCIQLDAENKCKIFGDPLRPEVCSAFAADPDICGTTREDAIRVLNLLEQETGLRPGLKPEIKSVL